MKNIPTHSFERVALVHRHLDPAAYLIGLQQEISRKINNLRDGRVPPPYASNDPRHVEVTLFEIFSTEEEFGDLVKELNNYDAIVISASSYTIEENQFRILSEVDVPAFYLQTRDFIVPALKVHTPSGIYTTRDPMFRYVPKNSPSPSPFMVGVYALPKA